MTAQDLLLSSRHGDYACFRHLRPHHAVIHRNAKNERESFRQAAFHGVQVLNQALVSDGLVLLRVREALLWWLLRELCDIVRPLGFRAHTAVSDKFNSVANLRATIFVHCSLHSALPIVNEQARWS